MSRTDHFMGLNDRAYKLVEGATPIVYDVLQGAFYNVSPLHKYEFDDGRVWKEYVQAEPWASGPHFFLALEDEDGDPVPASLWTQAEIDECV